MSHTHMWVNQRVLWGHKQKCVLSACPCLALDVKWCNDLHTLWLVVSRWDRRLRGVDSLNHLIMSVRASYTGNRKWLRQGEDGESSCKSPWENLSLSLSVTAVWQLSLTHALLWSSKYLETYLHFFNRIWISRIRIYIHRPCWYVCSAMAFLVCMRGVLSFIDCDRGGWVFSNGSERWSDIRHNTWRAKGAQLRKASSLKEKLQLKMDILPLFCNLEWSFDRKFVYFFLHKFSNWLCTKLWT